MLTFTAPLVAQILGFIGTIRILNLISNPCWLVYNIYMGSIAGMITDSLVTLSVLIAIVRLDIFPKKVSEV